MSKQKLEKVLKDLACHDKELSILFTGDQHIADLNNLYLHRQGPTNVLAFPMADEDFPELGSKILGDVVISVDTALREATETGEPVTQTFYRLLIHGILHLLGYDHERSNREALRMECEEKRLLALIMEE